MASIANFGFLARIRCDASHHVIRFHNGRPRQSGRGLVFWFRPDVSSIAEIPMDDRETAIFVKGRSSDFQEVNVQGSIGWRVLQPDLLAERIDFTIALANGRHVGEPIDRIESRIAGLVSQAALDYLAGADVRKLIDLGIDPLRQKLESVLAGSPALTEIGISLVSVRMQNLTPSSELQRALETPTFESLQQKADEATFERRALAVEKERAIAENELTNRVELARQEKQLIEEEAQNARNRAQGVAEASQIEANAEAARIRVVETARAEAEAGHMAAYRDVPSAVLLGLAAREFAGKLENVEHLNITPDLVANILKEFSGRAALPASEAQ